MQDEVQDKGGKVMKILGRIRLEGIREQENPPRHQKQLGPAKTKGLAYPSFSLVIRSVYACKASVGLFGVGFTILRQQVSGEVGNLVAWATFVQREADIDVRLTKTKREMRTGMAENQSRVSGTR